MFRPPRQQQQTECGYQPDVEQCVHHGVGTACGDRADRERPRCGQHPPDVVAEACPRGAQPCREQFRQVVREAAEHAEYRRADREVPVKPHARRPVEAEGDEDRQRAGGEVDAVQGASSEELRDRDRQQRAEQPAEVEPARGAELPVLDQSECGACVESAAGRRGLCQPRGHGWNERVATPPRDQRHHRHADTRERDMAQVRCENFCQAYRCGVAHGLSPAFGFLEKQAHHERGCSREQAGQENDAPRHCGVLGHPHAGNTEIDERGEEQAGRRCGIEQRTSLDAALLRHHLGDHRRAGSPFAADAERGDHAAQREYPDVRGSRAGGRAECVQQHREQQCLLAPDAVADMAEQHAAGRPAEQQQRSQYTGPVESGAACRSRSDLESEQGGNAVRRHIVEQQAVEDIETPAQPRGEQHRPLVARHPHQHRMLSVTVLLCSVALPSGRPSGGAV